MPKVSAKFWWFGITTGAVTSLAVTLVVVIWEWLENPGGIFHSKEGTNWSFVMDTAISWFVPTFVHVTVVAALAHWVWLAFRKRSGNGGK